MAWSDWIAPGAAAAILVAFVQLLTWWSNRGKVKAETVESLSGAAVELLTPYREEVRELRAEIKELQTSIGMLQQHLQARDDKLDAQAAVIESQHAANDRQLRKLAALAAWSHDAYMAMSAAGIAIDGPPIDEHDLEQ